MADLMPEDTRFVRRVVTLTYTTPFNGDAPDESVLTTTEDLIFAELLMHQTISDALGRTLVVFSVENTELTDPAERSEQIKFWDEMNAQADAELSLNQAVLETKLKSALL